MSKAAGQQARLGTEGVGGTWIVERKRFDCFRAYLDCENEGQRDGGKICSRKWQSGCRDEM